MLFIPKSNYYFIADETISKSSEAIDIDEALEELLKEEKEEVEKKSDSEIQENGKVEAKHIMVEVKIENCPSNEIKDHEKSTEGDSVAAPKQPTPTSVVPQKAKVAVQETPSSTASSYLPNMESFSQFTQAMGSAKTALESFTGMMMFSDKTDANAKNSTLSTSASQSSQMNVAPADTLLAPAKKQEHCLVVEGTSNYFFWMEKIAKVS